MLDIAAALLCLAFLCRLLHRLCVLGVGTSFGLPAPLFVLPAWAFLFAGVLFAAVTFAAVTARLLCESIRGAHAHGHHADEHQRAQGLLARREFHSSTFAGLPAMCGSGRYLAARGMNGF